jgi:hypothetical protein
VIEKLMARWCVTACSADFVSPRRPVEVNSVRRPINRVLTHVFGWRLPFLNHERSSRHFKIPTMPNLVQGSKRGRILPGRSWQPRKSFNVARTNCERDARGEIPLKVDMTLRSGNIGNILRHTESGFLEDTSQMNGKRLSLPPHVMQPCRSEEHSRNHEKRETAPTSLL